MKRAFSLLLTLVLALSLTACGASSKAENSIAYSSGVTTSPSRAPDMKLDYATNDMGWAEAPMEESAVEMDKATESGSSSPPGKRQDHLYRRALSGDQGVRQG